MMKGRTNANTNAGAPPFLVVGLGNPGERYRCNRHNIGFCCVERLAQTYGIELNKKRFKAVWGQGRIEGQPVILAMPQTFMNDSGEAVAPLSRWFKIPPERIMVIYDDLDLPTGRVRLRPGGSSGGHHGIESIMSTLGSGAFNRARIGIGRPTVGDPHRLCAERHKSRAGASHARGVRGGGARHRLLCDAGHPRGDEPVQRPGDGRP